uniref:ETS domain-containing protein n=1 Tax=Panagrellus redivivus TaxID=6233 RepID=A0A7E4W810_PANRE
MSQPPSIDYNAFQQAYQMYFNTGTPVINRYTIDLPHHNFHRRPGEYLHLWEFLYELLKDGHYSPIIQWWDFARGMFTILRTEELAFLWGKHKQKPSMNFDKLSRALRYYYDRGIMSKVTDPSAPKHTFQFGRLDIVMNPREAAATGWTSARVKPGLNSHITPVHTADNLRPVASIAAGTLDPGEPSGSRERDRDSVSTISIDTDAMGDPNPQQPELSSNGASPMAAVGDTGRADDVSGVSMNNADLQKLYAECFATSNNNNPLLHVFQAWYQQAITMNNQVNGPTPNPEQRSVDPQPTAVSPIQATDPVAMIPTPPLLAPASPQRLQNKKRRMDDATSKVAKRPRPMVIQDNAQLQKALGVPKNVPFLAGNKVWGNAHQKVRHPRVPQHNNHRHAPQIQCVQQQIEAPPVLSPIRPRSPATNTTISSTSTVSPRPPQLDRSGSATDDGQLPSVEGEKSGGGSGGQSVADQLVKIVDLASTKNPRKDSTDLGTVVTKAQESLSESGTFPKFATYFKMHEFLAGQTTLSFDEKVIFDALNRILINQVVRPVFAKND